MRQRRQLRQHRTSHMTKQRNPIPILLGAAIVTGGVALITTLADLWQRKEYSTFKSTLPSVLPPPAPKPPSDIISPGPEAVGEVIYKSQVSWKEALEGSMGGPDIKRNYTSLWIAGLGLMLALGMRK